MLNLDGRKVDWKKIPFMACVEGNALDSHFTLKVYAKLLSEIREKKLEKLYDKLISPLSLAFRDIEYEGMLINEEKLEELGLELKGKIDQASDSLRESASIDKEVNLNSSHALCRILFSLEKGNEGEWDILEEGFGLYPFAWTGKGQPVTDEDTLFKIKEMVEEEYVKRGLSAD